MGGKNREPTAVLLDAGRPEGVPALVDFLRRLDYDADPVGGRKVEATGPSGWPAPLARTALEHFINAWNRAHPEEAVVIEDADRGRDASAWAPKTV